MTDLTLFSGETVAQAGAAPGDVKVAEGTETALNAPSLSAAHSEGTRRHRDDEQNGAAPTNGTGAGIGGFVEGSGSACGRVAAGDPLASAAGLLEALVAALRAVGGDLLEERLGFVGRCEARLASVRSDTVAELARRDGEARAAEAVRRRLRTSRGAAKGDVKLARQLTELPATAEALADGAITPRHARIIADAAEDTAVDEAELLVAAGNEPSDLFARTVREHVNECSADEDPVEVRRRQRAKRELSISRRPDGMYKLFGLFDPVAGVRVETALAAEARRLRRNEDPNDRATPPQRSADALEQLVCRTGSGKAQTTTLLVVAEYDTLTGQLAGGELLDGTPLSADELRRLALEAKLLPAIFDADAQPLWLGREQRDANAAQRTALAVRDRGCIGCRASVNYCQPHHIRHWEHGGPTDIDNLCLLCAHCHHVEIHTNGATIARLPHGRLALCRPDGTPDPDPRLGDGPDPPARPNRPGDAAETVNHPLRR